MLLLKFVNENLFTANVTLSGVNEQTEPLIPLQNTKGRNNRESKEIRKVFCHCFNGEESVPGQHRTV